MSESKQYKPDKRRKDLTLRRAIDNFNRKVWNVNSCLDIYKHILDEILPLTNSDFAFVLERNYRHNSNSYTMPICAAVSTAKGVPGNSAANNSPQNPDADQDRNRLLLSDSAAHSLGLALNTVFVQNSPRIYKDNALKMLPVPDHWPVIKECIVIPLVEYEKTFAVIVLGTADDSWHYKGDMVKRLWPLLTAAICSLRTLRPHLEKNIDERNRPPQSGTNPQGDFLPRTVSVDARVAYEKLESHSMEGIIELNENLTITRFNPAAEKIFGITAHRAVGMDISCFIPERFPNEHRIRSFSDSGYIRHNNIIKDVSARRMNDDIFQTDIVSYSYLKDNQRHYTLLVQDKSELAGIQKIHLEETRRFKAVSDMAPVGILQTNSQWECCYVNDRWCAICAIQKEDVMGFGWINVIHSDDVTGLLEELRSNMLLGNEFNCQCRLQNPFGAIVWGELNFRPLYNNDLQMEGFIATLIDMSYHHATEERLRNIAELDALTGLANRLLFQERLRHGLQRISRHGALILFSLDLDGFKDVNDTLGHDAGDDLLIKVADRIKQQLRADDTVGRLGGDEFAILIEDIKDPLIASDVAEKILQSLSRPYTINNQEVFVTASIGITFALDEYQCDSQSLFKQADIALYRAKHAGRNNFQFFSPEMEHESKERLYLSNSLHRALEREEFDVYYQLQSLTQDEKIIGSEALLRWRHPERNLLTPDSFIPFLEHSGLIIPVSHWLYSRAFKEHRFWQEQGLIGDDSHISVNLSPRQLREPGFVNAITDAIADSKLSPECVVAEITESVLFEENSAVNDVLHKLKSYGVKIALDDFGTGYSSLTYLKRFPVDFLKIDQSFIRNIEASHEDQAITKILIALARSLNLMVIAEGVEDLKTLEQLKKWECYAYQGYQLNRPCSGNDIAIKLGASKGKNIVAFQVH